MDQLIKEITVIGIKNCMFMIPMRPIRTYFGLISLTSSNDPELIVPTRITEDRHKVLDNYKIELASDYPGFGKKSFYVSDLQSLIRRGNIEFFKKDMLPREEYSLEKEDSSVED